MPATITLVQNFPNTLHISFHPTWEFPFFSTTPIAAVAPLLEKRRAITKMSMMMMSNVTFFLLPLPTIEIASESAEYAHAMALDTSKYLQQAQET